MQRVLAHIASIFAHDAIVSRERRSRGWLVGCAARQGVGSRWPGGTIKGNSTESWAKAKGSAAAGDSGGTHAAAPIVLRFWEAEALPISERSGAISGHEVRPCFWQTVITQSTTHPRRTTVLLAVAVIQFTVITHGLADAAFRYATLATRPPD